MTSATSLSRTSIRLSNKNNSSTLFSGRKDTDMQLYQKLCNALNNHCIDELGLLHMAPEIDDLPSESRAYYPLIVVGSKLGIAKECLAVLLKEAHQQFIIVNRDDHKQLEQVTRIMILLKPDNYTAMNRRKELIQLGRVKVKDELALIELIFTIPKHSKSSIAWYHRQWIYTNYPEANMNIPHELDLCIRTASAYPRNYYSWTYRNWILTKFCKSQPSMIESEYKRMRRWIDVNVSDYSSFQYLERVMRLYQQLDQHSHMQWLDGLIIKYPGHESLWCHRRFCSDQFSPSTEYCVAQHQFIRDIMAGKFKDQSLSDNEDEFTMQKEYALKFGLWQTVMEKRRHGELFVDKATAQLYLTAAPSSNFLPNH